MPAGSKPENGLLNLRASLGAYANLRPCLVQPQLTSASTLKPEVVSGVDIMIVRELVGGIYFGKPRVRGWRRCAAAAILPGLAWLAALPHNLGELGRSAAAILWPAGLRRGCRRRAASFQHDGVQRVRGRAHRRDGL